MNFNLSAVIVRFGHNKAPLTIALLDCAHVVASFSKYSLDFTLYIREVSVVFVEYNECGFGVAPSQITQKLVLHRH